MKLYDISVPMSPRLPVFPGDPPLTVTRCPGEFAVSALTLGSHSGTHLDLPGHLGLRGLSIIDLPLERLIGPCQVWDLSEAAGPIDAALLSRQPAPDEGQVLLRTGNSRLWSEQSFRADYQALTVDGAAWLVERGLALVGIDYLSIEAADGDGTVHRRLLQGGVMVLEGLDLSAVPAGRYELICLPLKLACDDGAPCRALLRRP